MLTLTQYVQFKMLDINLMYPLPELSYSLGMCGHNFQENIFLSKRHFENYSGKHAASAYFTCLLRALWHPTIKRTLLCMNYATLLAAPTK